MSSRSHTLVLGGGIVGLSAAYFLAGRGERVTVVERDALGQNASAGNAGILALGHPPLPQPGLVGQLSRLLFKRTNPVYVAPRADLSLVRWMLGFRKACRPSHYERSMDLLAKLGWAAGECIQQLVEQEEIDCEYRRSGWLEVFRTRQAMEHGRQTTELLRRHGYTVNELTGEELREREPAYRDEVIGAYHYADSGFANPAALVEGLARCVAARGAEVMLETEATELRVTNGRFVGLRLGDGRTIDADRLVLAAGSWTTALARRIGIDIPMQPGKGYHVDLDETSHLPSTTCVLAETFVAATPLNGGLRLAGTVELSGMNLEIVQKRLDMLSVGARAYIRGIDEARVKSTWCGLRPLTADGLPVIGWAPGVDGVFVATGHAMMGFLLGPLTGRLASEALLDGKTSLEISALAADRF